MTTIEATYTGGAFVPAGPVPADLAEGAKVELTVKPAATSGRLDQWPGFEEWMKRTAAHRQEIFDRVGFLPDSTLDIAEDRRR